MEFIREMFFALGLLSGLFLIIGFIKPHLLLWWEDTQYRMKVLKIYGWGMVICFGVYYLMAFI
ncbi:MAG: hypothetical protein OEX02_03370 [Cyclobacteriaceae bacterium]|nr:hypothetical protein [Cyclobacteriaceae bacterium]